MGVSRLNGVAILSRSWYISTSGLTAAILNFRFPVTLDSMADGDIEFPDPANIVVAFGILFLCVIDAEIRLVEYVGILRIKQLWFYWNWHHGKKYISRTLKDIWSPFSTKCASTYWRGKPESAKNYSAAKKSSTVKNIGWRRGKPQPQPHPHPFGIRGLKAEHSSIIEISRNPRFRLENRKNIGGSCNLDKHWDINAVQRLHLCFSTEWCNQH